MVKAGQGHKAGFCPADQLFGRWETFDQAATGTFGEGDSATGNCMDPINGQLGLSVGWGDIYRCQRPGQYVDFGSNGDGWYVVRSTVDPLNHVLESDDANNTSAMPSCTWSAMTSTSRSGASGPARGTARSSSFRPWQVPGAELAGLPFGRGGDHGPGSRAGFPDVLPTDG